MREPEKPQEGAARSSGNETTKEFLCAAFVRVCGGVSAAVSAAVSGVSGARCLPKICEEAAKAANEYDERNGDVALVAVYEEHGDEVDDNEKCHYGQKNSNHVIGEENVDCGEEEEKEEQERKAALALEDVVELGHVVCESASVRCRMFAQDVQAGVAVGGACWSGRRRGAREACGVLAFLR